MPSKKKKRVLRKETFRLEDVIRGGSRKRASPHLGHELENWEGESSSPSNPEVKERIFVLSSIPALLELDMETGQLTGKYKPMSQKGPTLEMPTEYLEALKIPETPFVPLGLTKAIYPYYQKYWRLKDLIPLLVKPIPLPFPPPPGPDPAPVVMPMFSGVTAPYMPLWSPSGGPG